FSNLPVQVRDPTGTGFLADVTAIVGDGAHSLALKADGSLWAWGANDRGQLGIGTTTDSALPVQVRDPSVAGFLTGVCAMAAGGRQCMALKRDGSGGAWGLNLFGQLGDGTTGDSLLPVQVKDPTGTGLLAGVTAIAAGADHSLALKSDGSLWAWGS